MIDYTITSVEAYAENGVNGIAFRVVVKPDSSDEELRQVVQSIQKLFCEKNKKITVWFWDRLADILIKVRDSRIVNAIRPYTLAMIEWDVGKDMVIMRRKRR